MALKVTCCGICGMIVDVNQHNIMMLHHNRQGQQCIGGRMPATGSVAQVKTPIKNAESYGVNKK